MLYCFICLQSQGTLTEETRNAINLTKECYTKKHSYIKRFLEIQEAIAEPVDKDFNVQLVQLCKTLKRAYTINTDNVCIAYMLDVEQIKSEVHSELTKTPKDKKWVMIYYYQLKNLYRENQEQVFDKLLEQINANATDEMITRTLQQLNPDEEQNQLNTIICSELTTRYFAYQLQKDIIKDKLNSIIKSNSNQNLQLSYCGKIIITASIGLAISLIMTYLYNLFFVDTNEQS